MINKPYIAMDAGFFINEWNGFPRAYVNPVLETLGLKGILKLMDGIENRNCEFRECLAYYDGETINYFESIIKVTMSDYIRGKENKKSWSELWYIVIPDGFNKTLSEFNGNTELSSIGKFGKWFNNY